MRWIINTAYAIIFSIGKFDLVSQLSLAIHSLHLWQMPKLYSNANGIRKITLRHNPIRNASRIWMTRLSVIYLITFPSLWHQIYWEMWEKHLLSLSLSHSRCLLRLLVINITSRFIGSQSIEYLLRTGTTDIYAVHIMHWHCRFMSFVVGIAINYWCIIIFVVRHTQTHQSIYWFKSIFGRDFRFIHLFYDAAFL